MLGSITVFLIVLSILILVHELGHFIVAKRNGIWVEEFGMGIPPRIWGKKFGETLYSINLLPFGGFVKLHGENTQMGITKPKRAFVNMRKKVKIKVVVAGVFMNLILAITAFGIVYSFSGIPRDTGKINVIGISENSPAMEAGLVDGDIIEKVDGRTISTTEDFVNNTSKNIGDMVQLSVEKVNGGGLVNVEIQPREEYPESEGPMGLIISTHEIYFPPIWQRPFYGAYYGFQEAMFWGFTVIVSLGSMVLNLFKGSVPKDVAGPVGIFAVTQEAYRVGILALINFVGILSMNLAIFNIIPFPALDGGRLLFILLEKVIGRKVLPKIESTIHFVGFAILILLLISITITDIKNLVSAGSVAKYLEGFAP